VEGDERVIHHGRRTARDLVVTDGNHGASLSLVVGRAAAQLAGQASAVPWPTSGCRRPPRVVGISPSGAAFVHAGRPAMRLDCGQRTLDGDSAWTGAAVLDSCRPGPYRSGRRLRPRVRTLLRGALVHRGPAVPARPGARGRRRGAAGGPGRAAPDIGPCAP